MAEYKGEEFKFPDEKGAPVEEKVEFEIEGASDAAPEVEVVDDTPPEDRGRTPMKDPPAEVTDDELEKYSADVKKRIQHFSKGYHEERRAKEAALREREEALKLAQQVWEENKRLQTTLGQGRAAILDRDVTVATARLEAAKKKYKEAYEAGDADALVAAQLEISEATVDTKVATRARDNALQPKETEVKPEPTAQVTPPPVDQKAKSWLSANPWFETNRKMRNIALAIHDDLAEKGYDLSSDEYYDKLNAEIREIFPSAFPSEKPQPKKAANVVAPATRSTAPKKIVLTQSQVNIAKRLGVPLEVYARQVAEELRNQNV